MSETTQTIETSVNEVGQVINDTQATLLADTNIWLVAAVACFIGFILAYIVIRFTSGSVKKQVKTESELKQVKTQIAQQNEKIETHFAESAELLQSLAKDYQRLYKHLATSSSALLSDEKSAALFNQSLLSDKTSIKDEDNVLNDKGSDDITINKDSIPKDYSQGNSGLLKS